MFMEQVFAAGMPQSSLQGRIHGVLRKKYWFLDDAATSFGCIHPTGQNHLRGQRSSAGDHCFAMDMPSSSVPTRWLVFDGGAIARRLYPQVPRIG